MRVRFPPGPYLFWRKFIILNHKKVYKCSNLVKKMALKKNSYEEHAAKLKNENDLEEELDENGESIEEVDKDHFEDEDIDKEIENEFDDEDW